MNPRNGSRQFSSAQIRLLIPLREHKFQHGCFVHIRQGRNSIAAYYGLETGARGEKRI